jgi:hypothetical protein
MSGTVTPWHRDYFICTISISTMHISGNMEPSFKMFSDSFIFRKDEEYSPYLHMLDALALADTKQTRKLA